MSGKKDSSTKKTAVTRRPAGWSAIRSVSFPSSPPWATPSNSEDDEKVVLFKKARKAIIEQALKGTEKLKGKEKRKAELAILQKTNVQVLRDEEGKARSKKIASILKRKQTTK